MPDFNTMAMVDPQGRLHEMGGLSHLDWCQVNRHLVRFAGTEDLDYEPAEGDRAVFDDEGRIAFDAFKDQGWIRVKPHQGVEVDGLHEDNLFLVKMILRSIARSCAGRTLYVDDGDGSRSVVVDFRGRPDFSAIEEKVKRDRHRYGG